jgi:hypothetical protein
MLILVLKAPTGTSSLETKAIGGIVRLISGMLTEKEGKTFFFISAHE